MSLIDAEFEIGVRSVVDEEAVWNELVLGILESVLDVRRLERPALGLVL